VTRAGASPVGALLDTLRFGDADVDVLARAWRAADTRGFAALAALEECEPWLHRRLHALGLMAAIEPGAAEALTRRARLVSAHGMLVDAQVAAVVRALNELGVPHVILKGAARRLQSARYPYADARAMGDIDVLVPAERARSTWEAFSGAGFRVAYDPALTPEEHYHLLPIVDAMSIVVEIHSSVSNDIPPETAWRQQTEGAIRVETPGGPTLVPNATELFWHGLTHAVRHGEGFFRLRFLLDAASIWASDAAIDWDVVHERWRHELRDHAAARLWLGEVAWLARRETGLFGALPHGHLERLLRWRLAVLRRELSSRPVEKLLEESVRVEFGLPVAPLLDGAGALGHVRRRTASVMARAAYRAWRGVAGTPPR